MWTQPHALIVFSTFHQRKWKDAVTIAGLSVHVYTKKQNQSASCETEHNCQCLCKAQPMGLRCSRCTFLTALRCSPIHHSLSVYKGGMRSADILLPLDDHCKYSLSAKTARPFTFLGLAASVIIATIGLGPLLGSSPRWSRIQLCGFETVAFLCSLEHPCFQTSLSFWLLLQWMGQKAEPTQL